MKAVLKADKLKKEYIFGENKLLAIDNVSLTIYEGEKVAITGPSGCGKSTLLNMLGLIVKPTAGSVFVNNSESTTLSRKQLSILRNKTFGYIVQDFALIEEDTVFDNIEIPLLYSNKTINKRERNKLVENILTRVELSDLILYKKVKDLSGGQRQRVAIARAIINNPQIILADEPTGSLDSKTGNLIMDILNELVSAGKTLILITHDESLAEKCNRRIKILDGVIQEDRCIEKKLLI